MTDEPGLNKDAEGKAPQDAKPTSEQKGESAGNVVAKEEPAPAGKELPSEVTERTREQFEKLTNSNKQLFEANQRLQAEVQRKLQAQDTFAPIQEAGGQQVAESKAPVIEQFIETDPTTGERVINEDKLNKVLENTQKGATQAAETAVQGYIKKQQAVDEQRQTKEAYVTHPEVDPQSEKFDTKLHRLTRATLLDSYMNPADYGNFSLTFKEAANLAKEMTTVEAKQIEKKVEKNTEEVKKEQEKAQERIEQGSLEAQGVSGSQVPPQPVSDEDRRLVRATRTGDYWALAQRLTRTTHTGTPTSDDAKGGSA